MSKLFVIVLVATYWVYFIHSEIVKREVCKENEINIECSHCGPKTCDDLGHPIRCWGVTSLCKPECVCIDGMVRDANGTCIPKTDCPSCNGDYNATSGCGNHCGNSCSDYQDVNKTCFSGCRYNSCDCKPGYVFHEGLSLCVLPVDCCKY
ncbi:hypothetical protein PYW08_015817 [Mythimna loreyi]|uniref:Uncharacterized protein n=1 Tax=Mythimna loreyi TaxID=667449 RepID=A0ACC2QRQ9_9NEOP|nr:hypothetical protein PYW08_015817 [Mythimna loreyi]